jgi:hypothetical protein
MRSGNVVSTYIPEDRDDDNDNDDNDNSRAISVFARIVQAHLRCHIAYIVVYIVSYLSDLRPRRPIEKPDTRNKK